MKEFLINAVFILIGCFVVSLWHTLVHIDNYEGYMTEEEVKWYVDSSIQAHIGKILLDHSLEDMRYEIDSLRHEVMTNSNFTMSVVDMVYPEKEPWYDYALEGKHTDSIDIEAYHASRTKEIALRKLGELYN